MTDVTRYAKVFKAFSDESRLRILDDLRKDEKCACVLLEQLNISQSTLSHHMKILVESGIVEARKEGKWTFYALSQQGVAEAKAILDHITTIDTTETTTTTKAICEC